LHIFEYNAQWFVVHLVPMSPFDFVILAAGNGTRMLSSVPKVFQNIADVQCISHIINCCTEFAKLANVVVVTKAEFANYSQFRNCSVAIQEKPLGTGDAVKQAIPFLKHDRVIVICGDMPLLETSALQRISKSDKAVAVIAMHLDKDVIDMPYGRIVSDEIIEYEQATNEIKKWPWANSGLYNFRVDFLRENVHKEKYLTDLLHYAKGSIDIIRVDDYQIFHGINTMHDLTVAENIMQNKLRKKHLANGIQIQDPATVYFSFYTEIESNVVIEQNVIFKGRVQVKSGAVIKAFSYLENCFVGKNVIVGPFARIRSGSVLDEHSEIGNFVEVKESTVGIHSKAKHLAYIGNATIGPKVNIGAGAITCNYDGVNKNKTTIGSGVMVGANCSLIAPINIGAGTIVAAGSVITRSTEENVLAIGRAPQTNKRDGAVRFREKTKKRSK
jgi:bifunctional UDP-N-acetylglucosamine pyrophosphorylase/glucosamine-1-phosphate N-acetyltransferase